MSALGRLALASALGAALACDGPARDADADARVLAVRNHTGQVVNAIYLSPHDAPTWQENVLGDDALRDGRTVRIGLARTQAPSSWDVRVEGGDGRYHAQWMDVDLRSVASITLRVGRQSVVAELEPRAAVGTGGGAR